MCRAYRSLPRAIDREHEHDRFRSDLKPRDRGPRLLSDRYRSDDVLS